VDIKNGFALKEEGIDLIRYLKREKEPFKNS